MRRPAMPVLALTLALTLAAPAAVSAHQCDEGCRNEDGRHRGPHRGGFHRGGVARVTQAAQVAGALEDTPCELVGNIVEQTGYDRYLFRDASGAVVVDIDRKRFRGETVTPETRVRLVGEVDVDHGRREVDVDYLEVLR